MAWHVITGFTYNLIIQFLAKTTTESRTQILKLFYLQEADTPAVRCIIFLRLCTLRTGRVARMEIICFDQEIMN